MASTATPPLKRKVTSTVVTETIPTNGSLDAQPQAFYDGDPWEVIGRIHNELEKRIPWEQHIARVYRVSDRGDSESVPENNKFTEPFDVDSLRERFGGGNYKIWIYGPPERTKLVVRPFIVRLDGSPKSEGQGSSRPSNGTSGDAIALEAMRMYANPEFMKLQMEMMRAGALQALEIVKSQIPAAQDPLATLRNAKEILGVGNSQEGGLLASIHLLKELGLIGSPEKKGVEELIGMISTLKNAGLFPTATPKMDITSTLVSNIPMLVDRFVGGLHEFRLKSEADERVMRLQRGEMRPSDPNTITMDPQAPAVSQPPPANQRPAPVTNVSQVTPEIAQAIIAQAHLHRIVNGIKQPNSTAQDMYDYFLNAWPEMLDELVKFKSEDLLAFFKSREAQIQFFGNDILAQVGDDPRLPKMLDEFLAIAKKEHEPAAANAGVV